MIELSIAGDLIFSLRKKLPMAVVRGIINRHQSCVVEMRNVWLLGPSFNLLMIGTDQVRGRACCVDQTLSEV
jgi:hypothetical protein